MATWYRVGTASVTNGSTAVTGVSTLWATQVKQGDVFTIDAQKWYEVDVVNSNTSITLKSAYTGTTASAQSYAIIRNFTNTTNADLATSLAGLLTKWHNREDELVNWLTATGTVTLTKTDNTTSTVKTPAQIQNEWIGKLSKTLTSADVTLTSTEAGNAFLVFSGTLTANLNVIVPTSQSHVWFVQNNCTGSFTVTVKTSAGTGVVVDQGQRYALYCDGTNVLSVSTNTIGTSPTNTPMNAMLGTAAYMDANTLMPNLYVGAAVSSAYTISANDWGRVVPVSGTTTVTLPDGATMSPGFNVTISNTGSNTVTLARTGTNTIDGQTSFLLGRGMNTTLFWNGTEWRSIKAGQFGFKELNVGYRLSDTETPTWAVYNGNIKGYSFSGAAVNSVFAEIGVPYDYAPGTGIYLAAHWSNATATPSATTVRWVFEYAIAKSHNQGAFPAASAQNVDVTGSATRYQQMISATTAITSTALEPGSTILLRCYRDGATDANADTVFLHRLAMQYQTDRHSTANRVPTFYA